MSQADLERVKHDLATIEQALCLESSVDREDIYGSLASIVFGAILIGLALLVPDRFTPLSRIVTIGFVVAFGSYVYVRFKRRKTETPQAWRRFRLETAAGLIAVALMLALVEWLRYVVIPPDKMSVATWARYGGSPVMFAVGAAMLTIGALDPTRRNYLGWALPAFAFALAAPYISDKHQIRLAGGAVLIVGGLLSGAITCWQIRREQQAHGAH